MKFLTDDISITFRKTLILLLLFTSTFLSFYLYHTFLLIDILQNYYSSYEQVFFGRAIFYIFLTIFQVIGSIISDKISRKKLLLCWVSSGTVIISLMIVFQSINNILFFCALLGASYGLGIPSCFAYLAESTIIEERGRVSGVVQVSIFLFLLLVLKLNDVYFLNTYESQILSLVLRIITFIPLALDSFPKEAGKPIQIHTILSSRVFLIFLIPWVMFNVSNGVLIFIENQLALDEAFKIVIEIGPSYQYLGTFIFGFIAAVLADRYGRKQPLILGFIVLGIAYALVGIANSPQNWYMMNVLSGVGWGCIMVSYQWVILGDIAPTGSREKYYALGLIVPTLSEMTFSFLESAIDVNIGASAIASALSILLLLSVFPLLIAPETLPENKIRSRRLRDYIKKVGEILSEKGDI